MHGKKKYTCLIIDDEPLAIKVIKEHLENFSNQVECIGTYTRPIEAMSLLNSGGVDIGGFNRGAGKSQIGGLGQGIPQVFGETVDDLLAGDGLDLGVER